MALIPISDAKKRLIVKNVVSACSDIEKLNGTGYGYLYLASGFIAHYNIGGFKDFYSAPGALAQDIRDNARFNTWSNFRPSESDYAYYMSKRDIYSAILSALS